MIRKRHEWILEELRERAATEPIDMPRKRSSKGYARFPIKWSIEGYFHDYAKQETQTVPRAFCSIRLSKDRSGFTNIDEQAQKKMREQLLQRIKNEPEYIKNRKAISDSYAEKIMQRVKHYPDLDDDPLVLWQEYDLFRELYTRYEFYNSIWFLISDQLSAHIMDELQAVGCTDPDEIQTLLTPATDSFVNEESIELHKAAIRLQDEDVEQQFSALSTQAQNTITRLVGKFYWIPWGHVGPDLNDEQHYLEELRKLVSKPDLKEQLTHFQTYAEQLKQRQEHIIGKHRIPSDLQRLITDLQTLVLMQDQRKEFVARSHIPWVRELMRRIGDVFELTARQAANLLPETIQAALLHDVVALGELREFKNNTRYFTITDEKGIQYYYGEDAEQFLSIIEDSHHDQVLTGQCASTGEAIGTVRVLKDATEIEKVKHGDILVTSMTTPDYVPAMRRAAAIITDEGGITCHAAIVSRELKIPCVIGTSFATDNLKDGQKVHVDATNAKITVLE